MSVPYRARRLVRAAAAVTLALAAGATAAGAHGVHPHPAAASDPAPALLPAAPVPRSPLPYRALATKRLYIANDDHTDYMWSLGEAGYRAALPRMLDRYMTQAETTATRPPDQRARFNADGTLWVWTYERERTPAEIERLWSHVRGGTLTVPLNTCVQLYGAMPAEAVLRSMYLAGRYERREGVRFPLVVPMEDQTLPGGVASLWAGAGARFAWKGVCDCATRIDATPRDQEIYRFAGPDGQSVVMKWNTLFGTNMGVGGYAEARDPYAAVEFMDTDPGFLARWPWSVAGAFGYGWDDAESFTDLFVQAARDLSDTSRRVIVSNETDFFEDFEATYGDQLATTSACYGNEWDLLPASMGAVTSRVKRAVERLRTAEALASVATLGDPALLDGLESARDSMNLACGLYYEHSWSAGPGVSEAYRADWQRRIAGALEGYVGRLFDRALARVGSLVPATAGAERHLVFNPLSWARTDVADLAVTTPAPFHVVDVTTGIEVPSQAVTVDGRPRVRIKATGIPSLGYRVFEVRPGAGAAFPPAAGVDGATIDNGLYAVTLGGRGQLTSVVDHGDADRELVAPGAALLDLGDGAGAVTVEADGPVSATLRVVSGGSPAHESRVTLHAGLARVDYEGLVTQNFSGTVAYASTFAYAAPVTRHEEVGMIARAARKTAGGDYATSNARTDWLTFNHYVDVGEPARGAVLSGADSPFFQLGNSTPATLDAGSSRITAVVGMQVDGAGLGVADQGGDETFPGRFALRTRGAWDPVLAMRFALEHQNPLVATAVTGPAGAPLPARTWSLLAVGSPDVAVWSVKPAEEGITSGLIVRLWNLADAARSTTVSLPWGAIAAATRTTHVETDVAPETIVSGTLMGSFARQQLRTWRIVPDTVLGVPGGPGAAPLRVEAWPNPARPGVPGHVAFVMPAEAPARITLHDLRGARVATLAEGRFAAGRHVADWTPRGIAPGVYFLRFETGGRAAAHRVAVLD